MGLVSYQAVWFGTALCVFNLVEKSLLMKTKLHLPDTPLLPQPVVEQLQFLTTQRAVACLFLSTIMGSSHPCVVVLLNDETNASVWRTRKWVRKAMVNHEVTFLLFGKGEIASHLKKGTLFLDYHCRAEKAIYVAEGFSFNLPAFEMSKKPFKQLKTIFYSEMDLLTSQIRAAEKVEGYVTVFSVYTTLYGHYFYYLEWLLFGTVDNDDDIQSRLHRLCFYFPVFRKAFVKSSATTYFLLDALATVVEAEQDDLSSLDVDYLSSIAANERLFNAFMKTVFKQLKQGGKKKRMVVEAVAKKEPAIEAILHLVAKHPKVEAIYEYEKRHVQSALGEKRELRYWLIVGDAIGNHQLSNWYEAAKQLTQCSVEVVPIAHSRFWIQKRLFENQLFFQKVMRDEFLIYTREPDLAAIHWQVPYAFCAPDLAFYQRGCLALYETIQLLRTADAHVVHEGLGLLYSSLIARSCQVIIYGKLFYYPNHLPIGILWRLAELADDRVFQLRFLVGKLGFDLVKFVGCHQTVYRSGMGLKVEDLEVMDGVMGQLGNVSMCQLGNE